jgi:hypothetical protein
MPPFNHFFVFKEPPMKAFLRTVAMVSMFILSFNLSHGQTFFTATLTGAQENPPVVTDASGTGYFMLTDEGLSYAVSVNGLEINAAHFHRQEIGINGGVVRNINFNAGKTAAGIWRWEDSQPLTPELLEDLIAGNIYVNVHTSENPGGEIRGQVLLSSGTAFTATLTGEQEPGDVTTDASGTGTFILTEAGLFFSVTVTGVDFTAAHFHRNETGLNGPIVRGINDDFVGNTAIGLWTPDDAQALTEELIRDLFLGNLYVNVHSSAYPGGEIRGQLFVAGGIGFTADLDSDQETHDVTSDATGSGAFTLTPHGLIFAITVEGLEFTAAHFHLAERGESGAVVRGIASEIAGNTARGVWFRWDNEPLTDELIAELIKGNIYVNFHSSAYPAGEIRGQLNSSEGVHFHAYLTGAQENPAVTTDARGTGHFTLKGDELEYSVTVEGITGTAAHFHRQLIGLNGGVVRNIDFGSSMTAQGVWRESDSQSLTDDLILDLIKGNLYVNVHSSNYPGGEIRGQVLLASGTPFYSIFTPRQEVGDVTSDGNGTGSYIFTDAGIYYSITLDEVPMTASHFHRNPIGLAGPVIRTLTDEFDGGTATGVWRSSDTEPFDDVSFRNLFAGDLYVNIHSGTYPGGEIRGQVLLGGGFGFTADIDGDQESGVVITSASGSASFTLTDAGLVYHTTVEGLEPTAAHFHNAPIGVPGPVVRTITNELEDNTATGIWSPNDPEALTADYIGELFSGNLYLNFHTTAYLGGEIRGQIGTGTLTSVGNPGHSLPDLYTLSQNYPNPFNPSTVIEFSLNRHDNVRLTVYDLLGREVAVLLNEDLIPAGSYRVEFDAVHLVSGIYFYTLETGNIRLSKRMILVK